MSYLRPDFNSHDSLPIQQENFVINEKITTYGTTFTLVYLMVMLQCFLEHIKISHVIPVTLLSSGFDVNPLTNLINPLKSKWTTTAQFKILVAIIS